MAEDQNIGTNEVTDTSTASQDTNSSKTYSQKEFDDAMAAMKNSIARKYEKKFADIDVEEYKTLKQSAEEKRIEEAKKRGEFEQVLQELASKKDEEIRKRDQIIASFKVDTPLLEEAAKFRAVKPEQVRNLLKNNVRLGNEGAVEVVDDEGKVRYTDKGTPLQVSDLVQEFLNTNPHFVQPTPSTTNTKSNVSVNSSKIDITKLDMKNPKDREVYKQYRKAHGIA